jgi:hypothetical protein
MTKVKTNRNDQFGTERWCRGVLLAEVSALIIKVPPFGDMRKEH